MHVRSWWMAAAAVFGAVLAIATAAEVGEGAAHAAQPTAARKKSDPKLVKRGEYVVRIAGCNDCHTPYKLDQASGMPMPDMSRALSGHPENAPDPAGAYTKPDMGVMGPTMTSFALPFGIVYASNITSDPTTGIGSWKEEAFVRAMRTGRHAGVGRPILPPMPWPNAAAMTDQDLRAVFAYLQSTKPIKNAVPQPKVSPEEIQKIAAVYEKLGPHLSGETAPAPAGGKK